MSTRTLSTGLSTLEICKYALKSPAEFQLCRDNNFCPAVLDMDRTTKKTSDGFSWTDATGVQRGGLRCRGVVEPREKRTAPAGYIYDAIVIGAGYAGLMAARDMTDRGM